MHMVVGYRATSHGDDEQVPSMGREICIKRYIIICGHVLFRVVYCIYVAYYTYRVLPPLISAML